MRKYPSGKHTLKLKESYPISSRYLLRELAPWLIAASLILILPMLLDKALSLVDVFGSRISSLDPYAAPEEARLMLDGDLFTLDKLAFAAVFLLIAVRTVYLKAYEMTFYYAIQGDRLVIRSGILARETAMLPLGKISEVYLKRGFWDFIFGLSELEIAAPTGYLAKVARIPGLAKRTALRLEAYIGRLAEERRLASGIIASATSREDWAA